MGALSEVVEPATLVDQQYVDYARERLGPYPPRIPGGPANPLGARALYLYERSKDTLFRIHGTNQPEYIGQAISSGCIRMTNEDVIDLFGRVRLGATVIVLAPGQSA